MKKVVFRGIALLTASVFLLSVSCVTAQDVIDKVEKTFNDISSLEVEGSFCSVEIIGGTGQSVEFYGEILASKDSDIRIKYSESANTLKVWIEKPNSTWGNIKGKLIFKVPANTNIKVDNSSGSVMVDGIGESKVDLKASSGSIKASNIGSGLSAFASSGSLSITGVKGDLDAGTSSGSQKLSDIKGNINSNASSGSIKVEGAGGNVVLGTSSGSQSISRISGNLKTESSSGSININGVTGDVTASATSGSLHLDQITGALNLKTSSGSQKGSNIKLTANSSFYASSGSVSMDLLNDVEELSFDLNASSGGISAKGSSGKKNLVIKKGPITIQGTTSSGSQSYR